MTTIVTRAGKGSALTHNEVDANFVNLNTDKVEKNGTDPVIINANSSSNALRITQTGSGNALVVEDSTNPDSTPFVVDAGGNVVAGATAAYSSGTSTLKIQSVGDGAGAQGFAAFGWANSATFNPRIEFAKSRSGTVGTHTVVQSGDAIGQVNFNGSDGAAFIQAASITANVDGTPGTNDMPGRLVFSTTADGAASPTERMRIDNAGRVGIGSTALTGYTARISGTPTGATTAYGTRVDSTAASDVTSSLNVITATGATQAASFSLFALRHFYAFQGSFGAGSTVTSQFGFAVDPSLTGATNNYGFYSNIASGTGRWNFYANGTAANVFAGITHIGGVVGSESLRVTPMGSGSDYLTVRGGSAADANVDLYVGGSTTNVNMRYVTRGTGQHQFYTGTYASPAALQFLIAHTASAVNYVQVTGAATEVTPTISVQGSDANISLGLLTKGTATVYGVVNNAVAFDAFAPTSSVNYVRLRGAITASAPELQALGSDTNINLRLTPKGTGRVQYGTHTATADTAISGFIEILDSAGNVRKLAVIS